MAVHIIAEAGTNHSGDVEQAKKLVEIASRSKADSVKFQIIYPWGLYLPGDYAYGHYDIKKVIDIRTRHQLKDDAYRELNRYAHELGIRFSASVFDTEGLNLLSEFNPPYIKIASCDLNNLRFLREVAERKTKMVVSTGMSTLADIEKAVKTITIDEGNKDLVLLHCVSVYPSQLKQTNVNFLSTLKSTFGTEVGFSDHTGDSLGAMLALAKGATWFEKHFTIDRTLEGFDHAYAMEEEGFTRYIQDIRDAEFSLTEKETKISDDEYYTRKRARRSLYASRDMQAGEKINDQDVLVVRPEGVMDADQIDIVVGSKLSKSIKKNEPFTPAHF